jgi:hypothetical protein
MFTRDAFLKYYHVSCEDSVLTGVFVTTTLEGHVSAILVFR